MHIVKSPPLFVIITQKKVDCGTDTPMFSYLRTLHFLIGNHLQHYEIASYMYF